MLGFVVHISVFQY